MKEKTKKKQKINLNKNTLFFCLVFLVSLFVCFPQNILASSSSNFQIEILPGSSRPTGGGAVGGAAESSLTGDFNNDNRVNLVDFSIMIYWYKRPFSEIFRLLEIKKSNGDGIINIVDFSILAFHWTG